MSDDPQSRRLQRHTPPDCPPAAAPEQTCPVSLPDPYRRITDPCGNQEPIDPCQIDTSKFVTPSSSTASTSQGAAILPSITVANTLTVQSCTAPSEGDDVTIPAGTLSESVALAQLSALTPIQTAFLAARQPAELGSWILLTAVELAAQARLTLAQAQQLRDLLDTAVASVASQTAALATSELDCLFYNVAKTASCALDPQGVPADTPSTTVAAREITSRISQTDADDQAQALADSRLRCEWSNTAQLVTCPGNDVPNDIAPPVGSPTTRLRVGEVTVVAGIVRSPLSQADANASAQVYGQASLVCFYYNTQQTFTCPADVDDEAAITGTTNPITVAANAITSDVSQADANAQALTLAQLQAICEYGSDALNVACPADAATGSSPANGTPVVLAADQFRSPLSKADANALRDAFAASLLVCFWTNDLQEVPCLDDTHAVPPGKGSVAAGSVVSYVSKEDANTLAQTLATAQRVCLYPNDAATGAACASGLEQLQTGTVTAGTIISPVSKADANALAQVLANALNVCVNPEEIGGGSGLPGDQGSPGACTSSCFGFYS